MKRAIAKMLCFFGRHSYYTHQQLSENARRVGCVCCDKTWAVNDHERIALPWSQEFVRFYEDRGVVICSEQKSNDRIFK